MIVLKVQLGKGHCFSVLCKLCPKYKYTVCVNARGNMLLVSDEDESVLEESLEWDIILIITKYRPI